MIIGITGGTGCGKTTALQAFGQLGGAVLDCDAIYHRLLKEDQKLLSAIENRFPGTVTDGALDRKKLGAVVFSDPEALLELNQITHSAVKQEVLRLMETETGHIAIDAIGLFEGHLAELCDVTVAVTAPESCRVQRLMQREHITEEYALSRIRAQKAQAEFAAACDYTLHNDGTEAEFREKCLAFFKGLGIMSIENRSGGNI